MGWSVVPLRQSAALCCLSLTLMSGAAIAKMTVQMAELDVAAAPEPNIVDIHCAETTCRGAITLLIRGAPHEFRVVVDVISDAVSIEIYSDELALDLGGQPIIYVRRERRMRRIVGLYERMSNSDERRLPFKLPVLRHPGAPLARVGILITFGK